MEQANSYLGKGTKGLFSPTVQIRPSFHPDLEKRDAVVEAFKVRVWPCYMLSQVLTATSLCL